MAGWPAGAAAPEDDGVLEVDAGGMPLRRFGREAGLEFDAVAAMAADGAGGLWLGGANGLHRLDPAAVRERGIDGRPVVTGVRLFNHPVQPDPQGALSAAPALGGVLGLRYDQDLLTLDFALPGLPRPTGLRFRYRLDGFDRAWVETAGDEPRAVYTRLPPGHYLFEVEAGDARGWSGQVVQLPLAVRPPWWLTWWAKAGLAALLVVMPGGWYRWRTMQLRAQSQRLERIVAERTAELRGANAALHQIARTDALTGIANRHGLREDVESRWGELAGRASLLLADIDHFQSINDRFGHDAGDAVLVAVAASLAGAAAGEDRVGRWGGEEFLCLLAGGDAVARAEAMRRAVAATRPDGLPDEVRVSITAGLVRIRADEDFASAVRRADELLYAGKRGGRDRLATDEG